MDNLVNSLVSQTIATGGTAGSANANVIDKLTNQILATSDPTKWAGQGKGSAQANAADMAKIIADTGVTDISQFGQIEKTVFDENGNKSIEKTYGNKVTGQEVGSTYGENQHINFEKLGGITVIESDPPNFGGKTVLSVDLLMFLFFNTTTKTNKAEEIFNRYSDKDKVSVRGEIVIDGEDYIIVRELERKKSKSGEWNVKTELDFNTYNHGHFKFYFLD